VRVRCRNGAGVAGQKPFWIYSRLQGNRLTVPARRAAVAVVSAGECHQTGFVARLLCVRGNDGQIKRALRVSITETACARIPGEKREANTDFVRRRPFGVLLLSAATFGASSDSAAPANVSRPNVDDGQAAERALSGPETE